jgi:hypothetical protein
MLGSGPARPAAPRRGRCAAAAASAGAAPPPPPPPPRPVLPRRALLGSAAAAAAAAAAAPSPPRPAHAAGAPAASPPPGAAAAASAGLERALEQRVSAFSLPNGLRFLVISRPNAPVVSINTYCAAGAWVEAPGETGAHAAGERAGAARRAAGACSWRGVGHERRVRCRACR